MYRKRPSVPEIHASVTLGPFWTDTGFVEAVREIRTRGLNSSFFISELINLEFAFFRNLKFHLK